MRSERFAEHGAETSVAGPKTLTPAVFTFETTGSGFVCSVAEERRCILVLADCCALFGAFAAEGGSLRDGIWNDRPYAPNHTRRKIMGRGILLWLLGVPIPIIILLALFWH